MTTDNAIVPYAAGQADAYRPQIMTPEAARALDEQVRMCTRAVLREGTDYGTIPGAGDDRKVLLKPGAEKLLQWFGFGFRCDRLEVDTDDDGRKQGVTYRCVITKRIGDPQHGLLVDVTTCEGYAGYDEPKFYKSAEDVQRQAEAKERHWAAKDRRPANPTKWKDLPEYRAPWNTVIKMAQKRAIVGAAITATAAAGLFTDEDFSASAPADAGPSWYQRALGEAAVIAGKEEGDDLCNEATRLHLARLITRDQADHVKNRVAQRLRQLGGRAVVDVEDLAEATAARGLRPPRTQNAPPAETAPSPPDRQRSAGGAPALPPLPGEGETAPEPREAAGADSPPDDTDYDTPGTVTRPQLTKLGATFTGLGFTGKEREQRLVTASQLIGRDIISSAELSFNEAKMLIDTLERCGTRDNLVALLVSVEKGASDGQ